ncbi:MAG: YqzL family protein [Romboutsia sp.]
MNNLCWEVFKKTGSIEAYMYLSDLNCLLEQNEDIREIDSDYDNLEHPGDST